MQQPEQNKNIDEHEAEKRKPRHAAEATFDASELNDTAVEDDEILGEEDEIPLRRVKKKRGTKTGASKKKKKPSDAKKRKKKISDTVEPLFSDRKFRRKKSIFEIMSASGSEGLLKPIRIFGREIRFWPLFLLALVIILAAMVFMSNSSVQSETQSVTVVGLPEELENYRIVVVSDLNGKRFGDEQSSLVRNVESLGYDMILCVGDMVGESSDPAPFYEFLDGLSKPGRVYFIAGDADPGPYLSTLRATEGTLEEIVLEDWILGAIERGANYVDAPIKVEVGDTAIWLTPTSFLNLDASLYRANWKAQMEQEQDGYLDGVEADYNSLPFTSYRYKLAQEFFTAQEEIEATDFLIGLSHQVPDDAFIKSAATHDSDGRFLFEPELIVSGHYCGGVWRLPFLGAFYVPNRLLPRYGWFPSQEDVQGLSQVGESQVFISQGLSTSSAVPFLPFRLNNDPTITQLQLTAKLPDNMLADLD